MALVAGGAFSQPHGMKSPCQQGTVTAASCRGHPAICIQQDSMLTEPEVPSLAMLDPTKFLTAGNRTAVFLAAKQDMKQYSGSQHLTEYNSMVLSLLFEAIFTAPGMSRLCLESNCQAE